MQTPSVWTNPHDVACNFFILSELYTCSTVSPSLIEDDTSDDERYLVNRRRETFISFCKLEPRLNQSAIPSVVLVLIFSDQ
jgi:hypothetical protein